MILIDDTATLAIHVLRGIDEIRETSTLRCKLEEHDDVRLARAYLVLLPLLKAAIGERDGHIHTCRCALCVAVEQIMAREEPFVTDDVKCSCTFEPGDSECTFEPGASECASHPTCPECGSDLIGFWWRGFAQ